MDIDDEHIHCESLFREYKKLKAETQSNAQTLRRGQSYEVKYINPKDLARRKVIARELAEYCKEYFKDRPGEWFDIKTDATIGSSDKNCENCEESLKPSQYAVKKEEGEPAVKEDDDLVCRNYPACEKAEKEIGGVG